MKILDSQCLFVASSPTRPIMSLHEMQCEHNGQEHKYFMVARGERIKTLEEQRNRPDAVIIVAFHEVAGEPIRLVVTSEFRPPIMGREISFPAGMIDASDFEQAEKSRLPNETVAECAAKLAAKRELFEETGLSFSPKFVSPPNLYSSGGLTNECNTIVIGTATGNPNTENCESEEDIDVILLSHEDICKIIDRPPADLSFSKVVWPFLWSFARNGLSQ